ncbi:BrxE family protein [Natronosalvus halobius]|uniref:BrxE family protein n=1 Tax=Natronosalvus halobius TaxID=2953746 RepID=UPI00209E13ED|nr:BrxE family protein [Natronosalvus halobius]USZ70515.1 BrxE family protein [Natronosalvus halobius]
MSTGSLEETLTTVQDELGSLGVEDALAREVLSYRLLIERLGEDGNNDWWDSIVLTETGRDRLEEVTPKTATRSRIELAQRIGRKVEQEHVPEDSLSLFYLGPTAESQIDAELESVVDEEESFQVLESLSKTIEEPGWSERLASDAEPVSSTTDSTILLGEVNDETDLKSRNTLRDVARRCVLAYGQSTSATLRVPYYTIDR